MVAVAKWLTQTAVTRLFVGSIPTSHPMKKIIKVKEDFELLGFWIVKEPINPMCYIKQEPKDK